MGITETIDRAIPDLEYEEDEITQSLATSALSGLLIFKVTSRHGYC